jgi:hypothetical protein
MLQAEAVAAAEIEEEKSAQATIFLSDLSRRLLSAADAAAPDESDNGDKRRILTSQSRLLFFSFLFAFSSSRDDTCLVASIVELAAARSPAAKQQKVEGTGEIIISLN